MTLGGPAGAGLPVDRHQSHQAHQPPNALRIHGMAFVSQVPRHLPHTVKWRVQKLLADQQHQLKVNRAK